MLIFFWKNYGIREEELQQKDVGWVRTRLSIAAGKTEGESRAMNEHYKSPPKRSIKGMSGKGRVETRALMDTSRGITDGRPKNE